MQQICRRPRTYLLLRLLSCPALAFAVALVLALALALAFALAGVVAAAAGNADDRLMHHRRVSKAAGSGERAQRMNEEKACTRDFFLSFCSSLPSKEKGGKWNERTLECNNKKNPPPSSNFVPGTIAQATFAAVTTCGGATSPTPITLFAQSLPCL